MKIKTGIIDSIIETDNPEIIKVLSDKWAFHVNGYQYTPTYKRGHWDGKKRFVTNAGKFKSGMLNNILKDLNQIGCHPEVIKESKEVYRGMFKRRIKEFTLRDYQEESIARAMKAERAIINSPTGSGKTLIMASMLTAFPESKITVLFDERGILVQTYEYLTRKCGFKDVGINLGGDFKDGRIMLSTVQSIDKILDSHLNQSEVLMVDEVHKFCRGEMTVAAIQSFPNARYRFGFTATMPDDRIGELTLVGAFGDVIETKSTQELIAEDKLAKPIIQMLEYEDELNEADLDSDYATIYEKFIVTSEKRNRMIFSLAARIAEANPDAKVCIIVKNLEHLQTLRDKIPNCYSLEGINTIHERKQAIKDFLESNKAAFLIGTKVLQTGINIEEITHLVNARGLKDKIPTIQGLGRGMRKSAGKSSVMVYDFFDHIPYLKEHSKARIRHYEDEGHEVSRIKL
jgi:superfamily II DNA or RNA helicase